ncbi:MAG: serine/threonine protein kinase [Deltaproteobacteria bacterium]|nr:serine/threonine protein kinase [Deltaproteobacteria bacterium]
MEIVTAASDPGRGPVSTPPVLAATTREGTDPAAVLRMRQVLVAGTALWIAAIGIDVVMAFAVQPGAGRAPGTGFAAMIALRGFQTAVLLIAMLVLRRAPTPRAVTWAWRAVFVGANVCQAGFTLALGTIHGPYAHGATVIVVAAGLAIPDHWRRGLRVLAPSALAYPATILLAALLSPRVAAQLATRVDALAFAVDVTVLAMATSLLLAVGHAFWAVRRELFEARRLGGYRLRRRIAVGGMGEVWQAWHGALKRDVAVKILRLDLADAAAAARFEREAASTASLTHPNTVRVLDYGVTDDGLSYYAMELLDGATVAELVAQTGPMPAARVVHLARQAAAALAEAHAAGIVHRDIKPSNLLITTTGGEPDFVKLIDFGIARARAGDHAATLTQVDMVIGTPAYMAPEQAAGGAVDAATDVYALGAVCYFALTGRPLYAGGTPEATLGRVQLEQPERVSLHAPAPIPPDVEEIVMRCLRKDPRQRFVDAGALAAALAESSLGKAWRPVRAPAITLAPTTASALEATRPLERP